MTEMADLMIVNASELVIIRDAPGGLTGDDLGRLDVVNDGALAIKNGRILGAGPTIEIVDRFRAPSVIDATGRVVSPGLVDPHSHLVHAGSRHDELCYRIAGIGRPAAIAGGIHRTVNWTREADVAELTARALSDLDSIALHGTTTLEAKTGYGLDAEEELRLLDITAGLAHAVEVVPTFLAAHVPPKGGSDERQALLGAMLEVLPRAAMLAEYCDVCCDPIGFTPAECRPLAARARDLGMRLRVHADQTGDGGGAFLAAEFDAAAADHLDYTTDAGFAAMAGAGTVAVLLPGVAYHMLEMTPRIDGGTTQEAEKAHLPLMVRRAIASGAIVALSTDYNPGTCPTPSMQTVMQLAARLFRLDIAEIWNMCTINAAVSLDRGHDRGSLTPGKRADIVIWGVPHHQMVIDRFGINHADTVIVEGRVVTRGGLPIADALRGGWPLPRDRRG